MQTDKTNSEINKIVSSLEVAIHESLVKKNCKFTEARYYISTIPSRRWGHMLHELGGYIAHSKQMEYNIIIFYEATQASNLFLKTIVLPENIVMIPYKDIIHNINDFYNSLIKILSPRAKEQFMSAVSRGSKLGVGIDISANKHTLSQLFSELGLDLEEFFWPWMDFVRLPIHISELIHPSLSLKKKNERSISSFQLCALSQESGITTNINYINAKILSCNADDIFWALYGRLQAMKRLIVINIRDIYIKGSVNNVRNNNIKSINSLIDSLISLGYEEIVFTGPSPTTSFRAEIDQYIKKHRKLNCIYLFSDEFIFGQNPGVGQSVMINLLLEPLAISKAQFVIGPASGGVALPLIMNKPTIHIDSMHYITPFPQSINITKTFADQTFNQNHLTAIKKVEISNHQVIPNEACTLESIKSACSIAHQWSYSKIRPYALINKHNSMKEMCVKLNRNKEHRYILLSWGDTLSFNSAIHIDYDGTSYRFE